MLTKIGVGRPALDAGTESSAPRFRRRVQRSVQRPARPSTLDRRCAKPWSPRPDRWGPSWP